MSNIDVVQQLMDAYRAGDRETAEALVAADFVFTSPQDDHIDRQVWFERCFPTADRFVTQEVLSIVAAGDDDVFVLYEYELTTGEVYRNTEVSTVRDRQLHETQVFFGGRVR